MTHFNDLACKGIVHTLKPNEPVIANKHFNLKRLSFLLSRISFIFILLWGHNTATAFNVRPLNLAFGRQADLSTFAYRDNEGFLWIGTDNGIKRYDGYRLKSFTHNPNNPDSIGSSYIAVITQLSTSEIIAAGATLNFFDPNMETFNHFSVSDKKNIKTLYEDNQGILWLAGEGFGLKGFNLREKKVVHSLFQNANASFIQAIVPYRNNTLYESLTPHFSKVPANELESKYIWLLAGSQIILFNTKSLENHAIVIPPKFGLEQNTATAMIEDQRGQLWISSQRGLVVYNPDNQTFKHYQMDKKTVGSLPTNLLWSIFEDSKGNIWIGTDKQGILKYQPETDDFLQYPPSATDATSLPLAGIGKIAEDSEGNLWITASTFGIKRISPNLEKFQVIQHKDNNQTITKQGYLSDLLEDNEGNIWTAIDGVGLNKYNRKSKQSVHYSHDSVNKNSLSIDSALSLAQDQLGYLWIGTWGGGLNRLNPKTDDFIHIKHNASMGADATLAGDNVFRIEPLEDGRLLLSIWELGLQIYNPSSQTFKSYFGSQSQSRVASILDFEKRDERSYWVAGYMGLEIFDLLDESFTPIELPLTETILDIFYDQNKILWMATSTGLVRYDPINNTQKYYTTKQGLSNDFVVSIEEDGNGNLWLGTRDGLNCFHPSTETFETYDQVDGLAGQKFNRFTHLSTKDHYMYFGGESGLNRFDPINMPHNPYPPKIHLTDFKLFQTSVKPGDHSWMKADINQLDTITLPSHFNDIAFEFSSLNLVTPTKNRYQYRLEGLTDRWSYADSRTRIAHYNNLSPGHYQFKVRGSNNDGVWSLTPKIINIIVLPPWWLTWWAKLVYVLGSVFALTAFSYWLLHLNNKKRQELEYKINHDPLTDLPNRTWLASYLRTVVRTSLITQNRFCVFLLDGDNFKYINDKYGHDFGNQLIRETVPRIQQALPPSAILIRLEGDQFVIVMNQFTTREYVEKLAEQIVILFKNPFNIDSLNIKFRFNIGILISNSQYRDTQNILKHADIALLSAKRMGNGCWRIFDEGMLKDTEEGSELTEDLRTALSENQFSVVYQPIISLPSGRLKGFELLLRWTHPSKGMIPPDKFIPIAERSGLIFDIGLWVLTQACLQQQKWRSQQLFPLPSLAVNLSPLQLVHSNLIIEFERIIQETGADIQGIKLEITESALMEDIDIVNSTLEQLRIRGVELAIDDFGTGYSSMSYLSKLPAQYLKIDRSFVNGLSEKETRASSKEIIKAIISLAHNLKMAVIAEGIETQAQLDELAELNCDFGQGYFIDRPLTPEDATQRLLSNHHRRIESL